MTVSVVFSVTEVVIVFDQEPESHIQNMGVHGLQRFLQNGAPNEYCRKVNVKELAAAYRDETGREPVLLVDGLNCLRSACLCSFKTEDLLLGGQIQDFINNMKDFLAAFQVTETANF